MLNPNIHAKVMHKNYTSKHLCTRPAPGGLGKVFFVDPVAHAMHLGWLEHKRRHGIR